MIKQLTSALLLAGVLTGCSLAPTYQRPEAPIATAYPADSGQGAAAASTSASSTGWREFFPDRRLQTLIAAALDNNRDLRIAALRIEEARAQYNIQSADLLPTFNAGVSGTRARTAAGVSPLGGGFGKRAVALQ